MKKALFNWLFLVLITSLSIAGMRAASGGVVAEGVPRVGSRGRFVGRKLFKCSIAECNYQSGRSDDLQKHMIRHGVTSTKGMPFYCALCRYSTIDRSNFYRHEKSGVHRRNLVTQVTNDQREQEGHSSLPYRSYKVNKVTKRRLADNRKRLGGQQEEQEETLAVLSEQPSVVLDQLPVAAFIAEGCCLGKVFPVATSDDFSHCEYSLKPGLNLADDASAWDIGSDDEDEESCGDVESASLSARLQVNGFVTV